MNTLTHRDTQTNNQRYSDEVQSKIYRHVEAMAHAFSPMQILADLEFKGFKHITLHQVTNAYNIARA